MGWSKKIVGTIGEITANIHGDTYLPITIKQACDKILEGIVTAERTIIIFETNGHIHKYKQADESIESSGGSSVEIKFHVTSRA